MKERTWMRKANERQIKERVNVKERTNSTWDLVIARGRVKETDLG